MIGRLLAAATVAGVAYYAGKQRATTAITQAARDDTRPDATQMAEAIMLICQKSAPLARALVRAGADGSIDLDEYPGLAREVTRLLR